jgi:hypothetical protein
MTRRRSVRAALLLFALGSCAHAPADEERYAPLDSMLETQNELR